jgi:hypothetical protein
VDVIRAVGLTLRPREHKRLRAVLPVTPLNLTRPSNPASEHCPEPRVKGLPSVELRPTRPRQRPQSSARSTSPRSCAIRPTGFAIGLSIMREASALDDLPSVEPSPLIKRHPGYVALDHAPWGLWASPAPTMDRPAMPAIAQVRLRHAGTTIHVRSIQVFITIKQPLVIIVILIIY